MSQQWLWRSAGEYCGPLTGAELAELLRSRDSEAADEVQPVGASEWRPAVELADVVSAGAVAADAVADLLLAADELRRGRESGASPIVEEKAPPGRSIDNCWRKLRDLPRTPRSLSIAALLALTALVIHQHRPVPRSNADVYAELCRWHASFADGHEPEMSAEDQRRRQATLQAIQCLIADLESAAQLRPVLSISDDQAAADAILARRELLFAARDLELLLRSSPRPAALDASFRQHLAAAAVLFSLNAMSSGNASELSRAAAPPLR